MHSLATFPRNVGRMFYSLNLTLYLVSMLTICSFYKSKNDVLPPKYTPRVLQLRELIAQPVVAAFCAGGVAGAVSRTVVSPLERLKILFQIQSVGREEYKMSVGKGLMKMWREEGWRGLMRGNGTNCIRIVPYSAVQFGSYNFYKKVRAQGDLQSPILLYQLRVAEILIQMSAFRAKQLLISYASLVLRNHSWRRLGFF